MKKFKDLNNKIWEFNGNDFDEKGQVINKIAQKIIEENNLILITDEEEAEIKKLENEENLLKFQKQKELEEAEELTSLYEKLYKLGWS